jgi:hypothetical protein
MRNGRRVALRSARVVGPALAKMAGKRLRQLRRHWSLRKSDLTRSLTSSLNNSGLNSGLGSRKSSSSTFYMEEEELRQFSPPLSGRILKFNTYFSFYNG